MDKLIQISTHQIEAFSVHLHLAEVEKQVYQLQQVARIPAYIVQLMAGFAIRGALQDASYRRDDEREQGAELMTDVGEEAILHLLQFLVLLVLHTLAVLLHFPAVSPCQDGDKEQKIDELRPPGGPQRWQHFYLERSRLLAPNLVETCRIHLQLIATRSQIGEVGSTHSILRINLYPSVAHTLEPILIIGMRRHIEVQAREEDGDEVLVMFQYQFFCCR